MGGGKSSSNTDQAQTTLSADGIVSGSVVNISSKGNTTFTQQFPDTVADVMMQLIGLADKAVSTAIGASENALDTASGAALQAAQPDLSVLSSSMKFIPYLVIGFVAVTFAVVWKR